MMSLPARIEAQTDKIVSILARHPRPQAAAMLREVAAELVDECAGDEFAEDEFEILIALLLSRYDQLQIGHG